MAAIHTSTSDEHIYCLHKFSLASREFSFTFAYSLDYLAVFAFAVKMRARRLLEGYRISTDLSRRRLPRFVTNTRDVMLLKWLVQHKAIM